MSVWAKTNIAKAAIFVVLAGLVALLSFQHRQPSVQAAEIAGGISAAIAILVGFLILHPRLNYLLMPRKTRKAHVRHLQHVMSLVSQATVAISGSKGYANVRTGALAAVYLSTTALPNVPPGRLEEHFEVPEDLKDELANCKAAAEETIERGGLEGARFMYQTNLVNALGELVKAACYELGGHGYVTEYWERNLVEWNMCAIKQFQALRSPLGPSAPEAQLLSLLDRLSSIDVQDHMTRPLMEGDLLRVQEDSGKWTDTLKLTSDPQLVGHLETGMPVWALDIIDANGTTVGFIRDRTGFEPAPGE